MEVKIRAYTKKELCALYKKSLTTLSKWLKVIEPELMKLGYNKYQKVLTPRQVEAIFSHLDFPDLDEDSNS